MPSSDTETVGGVSDVSIDASSSLQEHVVDDVVVGLAVREAIRGLDALDISAIFSRIRDEVSTQVSEWRIPFCDVGCIVTGGLSAVMKRPSAEGGNSSCHSRDCCCCLDFFERATFPNNSFINNSTLSPAGGSSHLCSKLSLREHVRSFFCCVV